MALCGKRVREGYRLSRGAAAPQAGYEERDDGLRKRPSTRSQDLTRSPTGISRHGNTNYREPYGMTHHVRIKNAASAPCRFYGYY